MPINWSDFNHDFDDMCAEIPPDHFSSKEILNRLIQERIDIKAVSNEKLLRFPVALVFLFVVIGAVTRKPLLKRQ